MTEKKGITPEKFDEMTEKFRLETVHKSLKARNVARDIVEKYL